MRLHYLTCIGLLLGAFCQTHAQELYRMNNEATTRLISFENHTGASGNGGRENNGAKGHATETIQPGARRVLLDYTGTATIQRMWYTISDRSPEMLRSLRLQITWDHASKPAIDVPFGDFFGIGLGQKRAFESALFSDPEGKSFNCFIPMPFRKHASIIFINESKKPVNLFYDISVLEKKGTHDKDVLYFHAYWNRRSSNELGKDFEILPSVKGRGRFLGTNIGVITDSVYKNTWWGEGEVKMYIDSDSTWPTINGTGTEDYAGAAWGIGVFDEQYQGCLIADGTNGYYAFYRYHIPDEIFFQKGIRVTIQEMGGADLETVRDFVRRGVRVKPVIANSINGYLKLHALLSPPPITDQQFIPGGVLFYRVDDYSATSYFYLDRPENELPALQSLDIRTYNLKVIQK